MKKLYFTALIFSFGFLLCSCTKKEQPQNNTVNDVKKTEKINLDLTKLNSNMVYAEVFNMMMMPEEFDGKLIKVRGKFSTFIPNGREERAFTVIVSDALECCQQGLEFKNAGNLVYPDDFPEQDTEIEITGKFTLSQTKEGYDYFYLLTDKISSVALN